jgi:hypothetical protein
MRFLKHQWASPLSLLLVMTVLAAASAASPAGQSRLSSAPARAFAAAQSPSIDFVGPMAPERETHAIGGMSKEACGVADGIAAGLFLASLFACPACGIASGLITVGARIVC